MQGNIATEGVVALRSRNRKRARWVRSATLGTKRTAAGRDRGDDLAKQERPLPPPGTASRNGSTCKRGAPRRAPGRSSPAGPPPGELLVDLSSSRGAPLPQGSIRRPGTPRRVACRRGQDDPAATREAATFLRVWAFSFNTVRRIAEHIAQGGEEEAGGVLAGLRESGVAGDQCRQRCTVSRGRIQHRARPVVADRRQPGRAPPRVHGGTYHSHPSSCAHMSAADVRMARSTGIALIVATWDSEPWEWRLWDPAAGGEVDFAIAPL
jgi:proteasome lid subunit RPN8/RPN11